MSESRKGQVKEASAAMLSLLWYSIRMAKKGAKWKIERIIEMTLGKIADNSIKIIAKGTARKIFSCSSSMTECSRPKEIQ